MKTKTKNTRAITYRRYGIPALILEGKWLTEKYHLSIGDVVDIDYQPKEIRFKKNSFLSQERQQKLKEKPENVRAELLRRLALGVDRSAIKNQIISLLNQL